MQEHEMMVIDEYEKVLLGKSNDIPPFYFQRGAGGNHDLAAMVIRYAIETYLGWTPAEVRDFMSPTVIERLKLNILLSRTIIPPEITLKTDLFYIACIAYPKQIPYRQSDAILNTYRNVINKTISRYPKNFFFGAIGIERAVVCFRYAIEQNMSASSVAKLYELFASEEGDDFLEKHQLADARRRMFASNTEFLHETLSMAQKDDFLCDLYYRKEMQRRNETKKSTKGKTAKDEDYEDA